MIVKTETVRLEMDTAGTGRNRFKVKSKKLP
jgi:hypothetical protein